MKTKMSLFFAMILLAAIYGCKKDDPKPAPSTASAGYSNGVFIVNEGPFGTGTGTVDFYSRSSGTVSADIFQAKNGYPLGNIVQSMSIHQDKGYIVVNNAGKVEVVDAGSFASQGSVSGTFTYPRFFLGLSASSAYVSEWGAGGVNGALKVVDLGTNAVTSSIPVGKGAEGMVKLGNYVYVACSGGFDKDSIVAVVDVTTNSVLTNIVVGSNPRNIVLDANNKIWVLCGGHWDPGYSFLEQKGKLVRIDPVSNTVDLSIPFSSLYSQPVNLVINAAGSMLYYLYDGKVYSQDVSSSVAGAAVISRNFYGMGIDPTNDILFCSDAGDFISNGKVLRYNSSGVVLDSFSSGVIPGTFCFKP